MFIGYLRVSTKEQDASLDAQMQKLKEFGCEKFFIDRNQSGGKRDRPELDKALSFIRAGDTLVVTKLDRLSRSLIDMLNILYSAS
jgi:DNA invertase Pin-like site-specific DNA recombinase